MNFMFSWQEQYLTRSLRSLVRYCSCHENIKFISSRHRVISSIYPYLSYAILAWGSTCATHLQKIQVKQNHVIRLMFFATLYGKNTDSALPLLNLLDLLTVETIFISFTSVLPPMA